MLPALIAAGPCPTIGERAANRMVPRVTGYRYHNRAVNRASSLSKWLALRAALNFRQEISLGFGPHIRMQGPKPEAFLTGSKAQKKLRSDPIFEHDWMRIELPLRNWGLTPFFSSHDGKEFLR